MRGGSREGLDERRLGQQGRDWQEEMRLVRRVIWPASRDLAEPARTALLAEPDSDQPSLGCPALWSPHTHACRVHTHGSVEQEKRPSPPPPPTYPQPRRRAPARTHARTHAHALTHTRTHTHGQRTKLYPRRVNRNEAIRVFRQANRSAGVMKKMM